MRMGGQPAAAGELEGSLCQAVRDGDNDGVVAALREGADPNCQTKDWNKTRPVILAASAGSLEIVRTLLAQHTLDPNLTDELFGNTALIDASYAGNNDVVEELVADTRTEVNFRTERSGLTALMQVSVVCGSSLCPLSIPASPGSPVRSHQGGEDSGQQGPGRGQHPVPGRDDGTHVGLHGSTPGGPP